MDAKKHMIIVNDEIKTKEIQSCKYNSDTKKMDVFFYNNPTRYSYAYDNIEWIKEPQVINHNVHKFYRNGSELNNIETAYVFYGRYYTYFHMCFANGSERSYKEAELDIIESCLTKKEAENVFEYIKQVATLSDLRDDTGKKLLAKKFETMSFVGEDVALAKYLNPLKHKANEDHNWIPIFPFGCNNSQYKAVKNAMENQISVIQGPPGTGKTQTILNIIANILMQGKTVQIVSNNNSATENVYEKLSSPKYDLGFIVAQLGCSENKKDFIQKQDEIYPDMSAWKTNEPLIGMMRDVQQISVIAQNVFAKQELLAKLKYQKSQLETEFEHFKNYMDETNVEVGKLKLKKRISAKDWMYIWQEHEAIFRVNKRIGLWSKIKNYFKYGITNFGFYNQETGKLITTFQYMYYCERLAELVSQITEIENFLKGVNGNLIDDLCNRSMVILKDKLAQKYEGRTQRPVFTEEDLWKYSQDVLNEYPVILSTTFSSRNSLSKDVIYDYVIMDEASQVDIATGALAMSCARNIVIVGDTKQLPNVVPPKEEAKAKAIFDTFHIHEGYQFTKSFLQSVLDVMPNVTQTLLREHYRCHPKIINFCNQKFYNGELVIMTQDKGEEDVLVAVKTVQGNHERERYSQRQIDVIKKEILPKYVTNPDETGIITPYKNQVAALQKEIPEIDADTVHKFQGKEKDTIIISTVDDEISDFADDKYLINVAVSRAKNKLILVVTGNEQTQERNITDLVSYIQYNNFEVAESKVYSVFDYLYKQYTEERKAYLQKHKNVSEYHSENLMFALLEDILSESRFADLDVVYQFPMNKLIRDYSLLNERECKYARNSATHIDFLIFKRISKKPVLAVEVDGYEYHKAGTEQAERDRMKDRIMELYGVPLVRCATNGSGEREKIVGRLEEG